MTAARPPPPFAPQHRCPVDTHTDDDLLHSPLCSWTLFALQLTACLLPLPRSALSTMTRLNSPPPPSPPGAPHPAEPPKPSYRDLSAQAERAELVFRVHSAMSASPLHWTGRAETSGFCSPNPHLALLTPGAYAAALERLPLASLPLDPEQAQPPGPAAPPTPPPALIPLDDAADGLPSQGTSAPRSAGRGAAGCVAGDAVGVPWVAFERDPSIRQSLVDHCTRRTRPSHNWDWSGPDMAADDYSSWVSCTASLRWAVWEAAHRLVHAGEAQVDVAVIAVVAAAERDTRDAGEGASAGAGTGTGRRPACQRVRAGASGEVTLAPFHPLQDHRRYGRGTGDRGRMTNSEKEAVANAVYMAHSSDEVLFYGRIFAGSVRANLTFTREVSAPSERSDQRAQRAPGASSTLVPGPRGGCRPARAAAAAAAVQLLCSRCGACPASVA